MLLYCNQYSRSLETVQQQSSISVVHAVFQCVHDGLHNLGRLVLHHLRGVGECIGDVGGLNERQVIDGISDSVEFDLAVGLSRPGSPCGC